MSENNESNRLVLYTDGGCKPARGIGGWGVHGYFYKEEIPKTGSGCKGHFPTADGYKTNDTKKDGDIKEVTVVKYVDGFGSILPESTNNEAEVIALSKALGVAVAHKAQDVQFVLDSRYVLQGAQGAASRWRDNGWTSNNGDPVANRNSWEVVLKQLDQLNEMGTQIRWDWVKGHSGNAGNEAADDLASKGVIIGRKRVEHESVEISEPKGYWKDDNDYNRLISHSRWVFVNRDGKPDVLPDGRYIYMFGELGKQVEDNLLGKRLTSASFSILYLKEPEPVLEKVRIHQNTLKTIIRGNVIIGRLDNILRPSTYAQVSKHAGLFLQTEGHKADSFDVDLNPITIELSPPGLAFRGLDVFDSLKMTFDQFQEDPEKYGITVTDITPHLYERQDSKKKTVVKLRSSIDGSLKTIDVSVKYNTGSGTRETDVKFIIGTDIAKRNTLAAVASEHLSVYVLTWKESDVAFRYATVIKTEHDIGIWAGVYANLKLVSA